MKILCLGNNTEDTDVKTRRLAAEANVECHGLLSNLSDNSLNIDKEGYYHSSVYDFEFDDLVNLSKSFDQVIILDQPKEQYSHPNAFYNTIKLAKTLTNAVFIDNSYSSDITFFEDLVKTNKSFCIFPFIELRVSENHTTVCCRSRSPITALSELHNFKTDIKYQDIRNKMLEGVKIPEHCSICYKAEAQGVTSPRIEATTEWANRLNLSSLNDLDDIKHPVYYELQLNNICNLQCRMCSPEDSHLIGREYKKLNLISKIPHKEKANFDFVDFTNFEKIYISGGEPTAIPEFYDFIDDCIEKQHTNFEFLINTNGTKINSRLRKQLDHFSNLQFIVSIDGYAELNHYIRWPSKWDTIIDNMRYLRSRGVVISTNTTVSIYNVSSLYQLFKFFDDEFPGMLISCNLASSKNNLLSALKFPDAELALENLIKCQTLKCYKNNLLVSSVIDGLIAHYRENKTINAPNLKQFFEFNDKLDVSRNIKLVDYVPALDRFRNHLT